MSSFIVSKTCIDHVVLAMFTHDEIARSHDRDLLGMMLYELNRRAVMARYPGDPWPELPPYQYKEPTSTPLLLMQTYKSLRCFIYQCSEGEIVNEPIYLRLALIEQRLERLLGHRPDGTFDKPSAKAAYDSCVWG